MAIDSYVLRCLLVGLPILSCSAAPAFLDESEGEGNAVVGGSRELGYAPVGYLSDRANPSDKSICGVTLLSPTYVVTAAHCVQSLSATTLDVGFGEIGSSPTIRVKTVHFHPSYVPRWSNDGRSWSDVALLELETAVQDRVPATIARPRTGSCGFRHVGYGGTAVGGAAAQAGHAGERKSAAICVDAQTKWELLIHGKDGGLCWGDSGGPLLEQGTLRVVGVLSRHAPQPDGVYSCGQGNRMVFTSLLAYRDFLSQWVPEAFESDDPSPANVDGCTLDRPAAVQASPFGESQSIYGRVRVDGLTNGQGQGAGILAEVGYGPTGSSPTSDRVWIWYGAAYHADADGVSAGDRASDEYSGKIAAYGAGTFDLAFRFSRNKGQTWTVCQPGAGQVAKLNVAQDDAGAPGPSGDASAPNRPSTVDASAAPSEGGPGQD